MKKINHRLKLWVYPLIALFYPVRILIRIAKHLYFRLNETSIRKKELNRRIKEAKEKAIDKAITCRKTYYVAVCGDEVFVGNGTQMFYTEKRIYDVIGVKWQWRKNIVYTALWNTKR